MTTLQTRLAQAFAAHREAAEKAAVDWLRADEKGRGLVGYRDCWNIAAMLERGDHRKG